MPTPPSTVIIPSPLSPPLCHVSHEHKEEDEPLPIIVVGAGLTGLCAAYELTKQGHKVLVLERTEYLGGNVRSIKLGNGSLRDQVLDFGPGRIWKSNACIGELLKELHLEAHIKPVARKTLIHKNRGFSELFVAPPPPRKSDDDDSDSDSEDGEDDEDDKNARCKQAGLKSTNNADAYAHIDVRAMLHNLVDLPGLGQKLYDLLTSSKPSSTLLSLYRPTSSSTSGRFGPTQSLHAYLKDQPASAELLQTFLRSQAYGTSHELPTYLILPLLLRMILRDECSFEGHTRLLTEALARAIRGSNGDNGSEIKCGVRATSIRVATDGTRTLDVLSDVDGEQYAIPFAHCILACPLGSVAINGADVFRETKPVQVASTKPSFRYTATAQVCVELEHMPAASASWTHVLEGNSRNPLDCYYDADDLQIVSITNLDATRNMRNCVMLTLSTRRDDVALLNSFFQRTEFVMRTKLQQMLASMDLFRCYQTSSLSGGGGGGGVVVRDVIHWEVFKCTRPVINDAMLRKIQDMNARAPTERVWLAGSFASAGPCMETSVYSGRSVALRVDACLTGGKQAQASADFEARMLAADQRTMQDVKSYVTRYWLAPPPPPLLPLPPCAMTGLATTIGIGALCYVSSTCLLDTSKPELPVVVSTGTSSTKPSSCTDKSNLEQDDDDDDDEKDEEASSSDDDGQDEKCLARDRECQLRRAEAVAKRRAATLYAIRSIRNSFDD